MQMMLRDRSLSELINSLRGKKVMIWTCNTCARLCGIGGSSNAQRIATALRSEGIDVVSVASAKASCVTVSAEDLLKTAKPGYDTILALTCDAGARVGAAVFGAGCLNPVVTVGAGYIDRFGRPVVIDGAAEKPLEEMQCGGSDGFGPF